jgi:pimeloyl-ACP methyl ester carboxylesterase
MRRSRSRRKALVAVSTVAAGVGVATSARYRAAIGCARARISAGSRIVASRCGPIEYAEAGEGWPVLVVHGAAGGFDQGLELGAGLARAGFRVIAPSRFGYLRTPLPIDASPEAQADAHACLLDALGVLRVAVVGVSAGAPSALQLALRFPPRTEALVLVVPATYAPPPSRPLVLASRARLVLFEAALRSNFCLWAASHVAHRHFVRTVLGTPPELVAAAPPEERARVQTALDRMLPISGRRVGLLNDARIVSTLARADLEAIATPTLAISTADDGYGTFARARYTAEHISRARFVGFPSGGHMLVGRNAATAAEIIAFLSAARLGRP